MCIMSFLVVYFACHFFKNVFIYNVTCTMFIVQLFIKCSSFIGGIKVKDINHELGRYPLRIRRIERVIKYWFKVV